MPKTKTTAKPGKKIFIIEDDKFYSNVCKLKLNKEGYDVESATNFDDFLLLAKKNKPDLILMDIILPDHNGFEILKLLKKDPVLKSVKVIAYSSLGQLEDQEKAKKLGAVDYFVKSEISIYELIDKVKKYT
ncbi:MAG: response regulator [Patescibacteria group bacterium]